MHGTLASVVNFKQLVSQETSMLCLQTVCLTENNEMFPLAQFLIGPTFVLEFPQRSTLAPLFFLLYINNVINDTGSNNRLFTEDASSLFVIIEDQVTATSALMLILVKSQLGL